MGGRGRALRCMRLVALALLALLFAVAADAQPLPVGSGLITFEERLTLSGGCDSFRGEGMLGLTVFPSGSFSARTAAGTYHGAVVSAHPSGRRWRLIFDAASLSLYRNYLEEAASALCGTPVVITSGGVDSFELKLSRNGSLAALVLKTSTIGSTQFGGASGRHQLKGKGSFVPGQPSSAPGVWFTGTFFSSEAGGRPG